MTQESNPDPTLGQPPPVDRSKQLLEHRALVRRIASRMLSRLPANVTMAELEQAGLIGLNDAFARFDHGRGASFETYASRRIEGAMLDALRATDTLSRDSRARLRQVQATVQKLEHELHRPPRAKEVANELGWSLQRFHDLMVEAGASGKRHEDEDLEAHEEQFAVWAAYGDDEVHEVDEHADPLRGLQARQRNEALHAAFDALEERERYVMEQLYQRDVSMSEIAKELGLSTARVSQINNEIVAKLRRRLRDW